MNPSKPPSAREKIAKLRMTFVTQLPARIQQIKHLFEHIKTDVDYQDSTVEMHRLLHSLKGTGRSFGFTELGVAAGQGEDRAQEWMTHPAHALARESQDDLSSILDEIEKCAKQLQHQPDQHAIDSEPIFSMPLSGEQATSDIITGRLVYLCDDEAPTLELLSSQLSCFGYEICTFTDTQALHQAVLARPPDVLVLDINFPQGSHAGTEVLAALQRDTNKLLPAVFLSGRGDFSARLAAVQAGGAAYFQKPARAIDLVAALDALTHQQPTEPYRVLVIDDEPEIATYHSILLQEAGMLAAQLSDPSHVFEMLQEFRPDLVLMDMYMPLCSGKELAKLIRQIPEYVSLPIVYLSSETDWRKQSTAMRVGAEGFLTKPVAPEALVGEVSIRAERMRTLRALMARDSLTGLLNHTTTTHLLESHLATARRNHTVVCFAMLDVDDFKRVNDTHGHPAGDQVLLALARVLQQRLRKSDVVGRYGGEEFAVILPNVPVTRAFELINTLRQDFSHIVFDSAGIEFSCTFSAGIACYPAHQNFEQLRAAADKALYEAKRGGRNCVVQDFPDVPEQERP